MGTYHRCARSLIFVVFQDGFHAADNSFSCGLIGHAAQKQAGVSFSTKPGICLIEKIQVSNSRFGKETSTRIKRIGLCFNCALAKCGGRSVAF
jgi:hypothetical protein